MHLVFANPLQPLIDVFEQVLLFFHETVGAGWGLSIILLTVVVRAALIPLTLRQFRSMQGLQGLQPEVKELQKKYKDDKQRLQQETMALYRAKKVNPLGSCLPVVAQFPVFISLYFMLRQDLKKDICPGIAEFAAQKHASLTNVSCGDFAGGRGKGEFLFIPDLTHKAVGATLVVLIVLYVGSQLVSSLLMSVTADKMQRNLMLLLPLVFVTFIIQFPAGLIVYWITTNLWTIAQQYIVRRRVGPIKPAMAAAADTVDGAPTGGLAGFAASLGLGPKAEDAERPAEGDVRSAGNGATPAQAGNGRARAAPPPPPRKKKKQRSGRRR